MAWKKPGILTGPPKNPKDDSSFPGLKPAGADASTKIEYEELQRNEIFALEAIYGDDFIQHTAAHSAWKVFCSPSMLPPCRRISTYTLF